MITGAQAETFVALVQGAWMRFMYRMQSSGTQLSLEPEPHLGLSTWHPPPPPPKSRLTRQQAAPTGQALERSSLAQTPSGRNSAGELINPT